MTATYTSNMTSKRMKWNMKWHAGSLETNQGLATTVKRTRHRLTLTSQNCYAFGSP